MLVRMKVSRDLFYIGEIVNTSKWDGDEWIREGYAERYTCPTCGSKRMRENGGWRFCTDCGYREWK